jgi:hypothetical protein
MCIVGAMGSWGVASFENDAAADWFLRVEEAADPGAVMASAIDDALSAADHLEGDVSCEAIAAAELCACCAGQPPDRLPDNMDKWVQANPHQRHADEVELAVSGCHPCARGERAAQPLGTHRRGFSVAG